MKINSSSFVTSWHEFKDLKCQCDDGVNVHPWECCSTGWCNVFCCSCGGPCRTKNDTIGSTISPITTSISNAYGNYRSKRELPRIGSELYHDTTEEQTNIDAVNVGLCDIWVYHWLSFNVFIFWNFLFRMLQCWLTNIYFRVPWSSLTLT